MNDYISREAALKAVNRHYPNPNAMCAALVTIPAADVCPYYIGNHHDRGNDSLCRKAMCEVESVRPVVRGRWVKKHDDVCYWHECSECGERLPRNYWGFVWESLYCPNCGADMRNADD